MLLPAHATTSTLIGGSDLAFARLASASVEVRTPSSGTAEPAIASLSFVGCTPGPTTITAVANLSPAGSIALGSFTIPSVVPGDVYQMSVNPTIVAPVSAVDTITLANVNLSGTSTVTFPAAVVTAILTGAPVDIACG